MKAVVQLSCIYLAWSSAQTQSSTISIKLLWIIWWRLISVVLQQSHPCQAAAPLDFAVTSLHVNALSGITPLKEVVMRTMRTRSNYTASHDSRKAEELPNLSFGLRQGQNTFVQGEWGGKEGAERGVYHHLGSSLHGCSAPWPAGVELLMHLLCKHLIIHPILFFLVVTVYIAVLQSADGCVGSRGIGCN